MKALYFAFTLALVVATGLLIKALLSTRNELFALKKSLLSVAERADLQQRAWTAEKRLKEIDEARMQQLVAGEHPQDGPVATSTLQQSAMEQQLAQAARWATTVNNSPEALQLLADIERMRLGTKEADLFRTLNLPPDQLERLKAALLERQLLPTDLVLAAVQNGVDPMKVKNEMVALYVRGLADVSRKVKVALGDEKYAEYAEYNKTLRQRTLANQLRDSLSYTAEPLSDAQHQQTMQLLNQSKNAQVTDEMITAAENVLSPSQLDAFRRIQQLQQANDRMAALLKPTTTSPKN